MSSHQMVALFHSPSPSGSPSFSPSSGAFSSTTATGSCKGVGSGWISYSTGSFLTKGGWTGKNETSSYLCPLPT